MNKYHIYKEILTQYGQEDKYERVNKDIYEDTTTNRDYDKYPNNDSNNYKKSDKYM